MAEKFTTDLKEFEKLIKKDKILTSDLPDILDEYIKSVWYVHFNRKLTNNKADEDIDLKLRWVYELAVAIKSINDKIAK